MCPGFASDCIETLEEINLRARSIPEKWGENFLMVPCLNDNSIISSYFKFIKRYKLMYIYL